MQIEETKTTDNKADHDANQDDLTNNDTLRLKKRRQLFGKRTAIDK